MKTLYSSLIASHLLRHIYAYRETIEASKSLKKVRRTHSLGKNRMVTLLGKNKAKRSKNKIISWNE